MKATKPATWRYRRSGAHRTVAAALVLWLERLRTGDPAHPIAMPDFAAR